MSQCREIHPAFGRQCRLSENHVGPHETTTPHGTIAVWGVQVGTGTIDTKGS